MTSELDHYLVGGAIRNELLNLPVSDRDWVVVGATPEKMIDLGFVQVGSHFPVFLHPQSKEEYALARTEKKVAAGYTGFTVQADPSVTLEQDLQRRDLTINAIAKDRHGKIIDPYGGESDLHHRILRHISPAFGEDPVRLLRVARFAAQLGQFNFTVAGETLTLMRDMVDNGEVNALVAERVWKETEKALQSDFPRRYFEILRECGALAVLFPEIDALFGVPQNPVHHPEIDTGIHTMMVLQQATSLSEDLMVRFAALLHDLGKGLTPPALWPKHSGHEEAGVALINAVCRRYKVPTKYREFAVAVGKYHLFYHRAGELSAAKLLRLMLNLDAFRRPERWEQFILSSEADSRGRPGYEDTQPTQSDILRRAYQAATSVDLKTIVHSDGAKGTALKRKIAEARIAAIRTQQGHATK